MTPLLCWVEGSADCRFLRHWLEKWEIPWGHEFRFWNQEKDSTVNALIGQAVRKECPIIFMADAAENHSPQSCRDNLLIRFPNLCEQDLFIMQPEIEAWYLAGLNPMNLDVYGQFTDEQRDQLINILSCDTNTIRYRRFRTFIPRSKDSSLPTLDRWMTIILEQFDWDGAQKRNNSFAMACDQLSAWSKRWIQQE